MGRMLDDIQKGMGIRTEQDPGALGILRTYRAGTARQSRRLHRRQTGALAHPTPGYWNALAEMPYDVQNSLPHAAVAIVNWVIDIEAHGRPTTVDDSGCRSVK
jgi:hypothetical protein